MASTHTKIKSGVKKKLLVPHRIITEMKAASNSINTKIRHTATQIYIYLTRINSVIIVLYLLCAVHSVPCTYIEVTCDNVQHVQNE